VPHLADDLDETGDEVGALDVLVGLVEHDELVELAALVGDFGEKLEQDHEEPEGLVLLHELVAQVDDDEAAGADRLDRGMGHYADALAWARLILEEESPLTGIGGQRAPSLLFPMEAVFEAFVAKHLARQISQTLVLKTQARSHHLVRHREQKWFRLKPDLLIRDIDRDLLVLDTKWKLLDGLKSNGTDKYGLSQSDFYQLQAYGQSYLDGQGDVILIYPKTAAFDLPLPVFEFPKTDGLRLWVLPFCLSSRILLLPADVRFARVFDAGAAAVSVEAPLM
jgi:5-methylcytosine-specific restriction enzyme subunit McrC